MLKKLDLRFGFEETSHHAWEALASILRNPKTELVELNVAHSVSMNNCALAELADALRGNNKLKELPLQWSHSDEHRITNWKPLINAMCDGTSIEATFNSNHMLQRLGSKCMFGGYIYSESSLHLPSEMQT